MNTEKARTSQPSQSVVIIRVDGRIAKHKPHVSQEINEQIQANGKTTLITTFDTFHRFERGSYIHPLKKRERRNAPRLSTPDKKKVWSENKCKQKKVHTSEPSQVNQGASARRRCAAEDEMKRTTHEHQTTKHRPAHKKNGNQAQSGFSCCATNLKHGFFLATVWDLVSRRPPSLLSEAIIPEI